MAETNMDTSTEEAIKAIIMALKVHESGKMGITEALVASLGLASEVSRDADDPVTARDLKGLQAFARGPSETA